MKIILVPVDLSDVTERVVDQARRLAQVMGARVTLLHVAPAEPEFVGFDPGPPSVRAAEAQHLATEHRKTQALKGRLEDAGLQATALVVQGYPVEKIVQEAERLAAGLIVMGSHGHGALHHLLVGSVTEGVLRKARCPVVVVPARVPA